MLKGPFPPACLARLISWLAFAVAKSSARRMATSRLTLAAFRACCLKLILHQAEFFGGSGVFCPNACAEKFRRWILAEYFSGGKVETISTFSWRKIPLHLSHESNQRMTIASIVPGQHGVVLIWAFFFQYTLCAATS